MTHALSRYLPHYRALLSLGMPIVVGQLGVIVLGFADTLMIGHHSTPGLAAASFVNNMFNLCIIFSTGFSYGLTPIVGNLYGRSRLAEAGLALRCSLAANTAVAVLQMLVMGALYLCLDGLGQPPELMPLIKPYYLVLLASLPFVMLFNGFKQFTDGITQTRTAMWLLLAGNAMNIVGNYLLIYGKLGLPELGLLGAGISTLASRIAMVVAFAWLVLRARRFARYRAGLLRWRWSASFSLSIIMVGWLGTVALAGHQVMLTISQFTFMLYYGMGAAVAVRVSNFRGAGDVASVRRTAYAGFHLILLVAAVLLAALWCVRGQVGTWFTDSAEVAALVPGLFVPFLVYQFGDGLQICFANALRGIEDVKPMMVIAFVAYFVISLPAGYLFAFPLGLGLEGIWWAFPFGLTSAGLMLWARFASRTRPSRG